MKLKFRPEMWPVERYKFDPAQWGDKPIQKKQNASVYSSQSTTSDEDNVEVVLQRIEAVSLDLTCDRNDWIKLGFSFATAFGEGGRSYFHRVSCFYAGYNWTECDRQYSHCLKGGKSIVTIKSFFWMARDAGIDIWV